MSDERQAFEQLHAIPSGAIWCEKRHIYIHKNYSGLVLHPINESWKAFCEGALWQASRQAVSVPEGWRSTIEKAINMASVFDDGGDGAKGVVSLLTRLLASPTKADERE